MNEEHDCIPFDRESRSGILHSFLSQVNVKTISVS